MWPMFWSRLSSKIPKRQISHFDRLPSSNSVPYPRSARTLIARDFPLRRSTDRNSPLPAATACRWLPLLPALRQNCPQGQRSSRPHLRHLRQTKRRRKNSSDALESSIRLRVWFRWQSELVPISNKAFFGRQMRNLRRPAQNRGQIFIHVRDMIGGFQNLISRPGAFIGLQQPGREVCDAD